MSTLNPLPLISPIDATITVGNKDLLPIEELNFDSIFATELGLALQPIIGLHVLPQNTDAQATEQTSQPVLDPVALFAGATAESPVLPIATQEAAPTPLPLIAASAPIFTGTSELNELGKPSELSEPSIASSPPPASLTTTKQSYNNTLNLGVAAPLVGPESPRDVTARREPLVTTINSTETPYPVLDRIATSIVPKESFSADRNAEPLVHTTTTPQAQPVSIQAHAAFGATQFQLQAASGQAQVVNLPVQHEGWREAFNHQVTLLVARNEQSAEIILHPPQLGPVEIQINLSADQASIVFTAAQQETRQALEDALPRLKEMLAEQGIKLGETTVGAQSESRSGFKERADAHSSQASTPGDPAETEQIIKIDKPRGLIDLFV